MPKAKKGGGGGGGGGGDSGDSGGDGDENDSFTALEELLAQCSDASMKTAAALLSRAPRATTVAVAQSTASKAVVKWARQKLSKAANKEASKGDTCSGTTELVLKQLLLTTSGALNPLHRR